APAPAAAPAPEAVPTGFGAAAGYGLGAAPVLPEDDDVTVAAVRATVTGPSVAARLGAEVFGTFLVMLVGLGTALFAALTGTDSMGTALAFGFGTVAAFLAVSHVSGGHFNPAITLGSALAGRTPWAHVLPYWVAQVLGGAVAAAVLFVTASSLTAIAGNERVLMTTLANGFGEHSPIATAAGGMGFELVAALLMEGVLTALLVGVFLGATDRRGRHHQAGIAYGLALTAFVLVLTPVTGGALNPARATAAAIFAEGAWSQVWVFWVAPLVGAALAGLLYRAFATAPAEDDVLDEEIELDEVDVEVHATR
ncbi:aquaporin, partial [Cellulomonas triticagri]